MCEPLSSRVKDYLSVMIPSPIITSTLSHQNCLPFLFVLSSEAMNVWWGAVSLTFAEGMDLLRPVEIDPGFIAFYNYAQKHNVPFVVVSCGLDIIIKEYLAWYLGEEAANVTILANYGKVENKKWLVSYRDDSPHSHDKSVCIKESKKAFLSKSDDIPGQEHIIVFCGDGISDLSAAREADILFARRGR